MEEKLERYLASLGVSPTDKKLPYQLKADDIYKQYKIHDKYEDGSIGQIEPMILQSAAELAAFLNNPNNQSRTGRTPTIAEEVFVKSWLPYFYNEQKPEGYDDDVIQRYQLSTEGVDSVVHAWVTAVAGNVYTPVNVLRDGEVIYTIPPVIDKLVAIGGKDRKKSVAQLYKDAKQMIDRIPSAAVMNAQFNHMVESINDYVPESRGEIVNRINYKYLFVMDEIFTYYGYDSILTPEIMSIKQEIMGYSNEYQPVGTISKPISETDVVEDEDDDIFGA